MPRELLTMTGTYAQFEGTEIVAKNCLGAKVRDLVIKGKTHISGVPSDYTILDYIESTGTQYIDTGFKANTTTTKFVGAFTPTQKVTGALLGSRNDNSSGTHSCNVFALGSGNFRFDWANASYTGTETSYVVGTKYEMEITRGTLVINGTTQSFTNTGSVDQLENFLIGTFNNGTTPYTKGFVGYIHECKLYSNDVLIRDFIPVKRISDNVVGMYDIITETFFTNAGTGVFVAGTTVVSNEIKSVSEEEDDTISIKINDYIVSNINLPIPLRSLPNGTCDTIENNQLIQRVGKIVIDGTQSFKLNNVNQSKTTRCYFTLDNANISKGANNLICNWHIREGSHGDYEYIIIQSIVEETLNTVFISVLNSKLETTDVKGMKKYFSENPLPVYYELTTPITHSLEIPSINTVSKTNTITTNNNIKPVISCKLKLSKANITS